MTLDFAKVFEGATTPAEIDRRYKEAFWAHDCVDDLQKSLALGDAARHVHQELIRIRDSIRVVESDPNPMSGRRIRNWCAEEGIPLGRRGRIPQEVIEAYVAAHPSDFPSAGS